METGYRVSHTVIEASKHHGSFLYGTRRIPRVLSLYISQLKRQVWLCLYP